MLPGVKRGAVTILEGHFGKTDQNFTWLPFDPNLHLQEFVLQITDLFIRLPRLSTIIFFIVSKNRKQPKCPW